MFLRQARSFRLLSERKTFISKSYGPNLCEINVFPPPQGTRPGSDLVHAKAAPENPGAAFRRKRPYARTGEEKAPRNSVRGWRGALGTTPGRSLAGCPWGRKNIYFEELRPKSLRNKCFSVGFRTCTPYRFRNEQSPAAAPQQQHGDFGEREGMGGG